jgi:hypothetical protein
MRNTYKKYLLFCVALIAAYLIFLGALIENRASDELSKARAYRDIGALDSSSRHYFQALNWYAPWGSSQKAADELMELATDSLNLGLKKDAFQSLIRLRSGLLAARSFYTPRRDLLDKANAIIVLFLAESKLGPQANPADIRLQAETYGHLYSLALLPNQVWYLFIILGFFIWIIASFWLIVIFFGPTRSIYFKMRLKLARIPIAIFIYGYALWVASMSIA